MTRRVRMQSDHVHDIQLSGRRVPALRVLEGDVCESVAVLQAAAIKASRRAEYGPPASRADCEGDAEARMAGTIQCQRLACRHNLLVRMADDMPGRRYPGRPPPSWDFTGVGVHAPSCALDVAVPGGVSVTRVAEVMGVTARSVQLWEKRGIAKIKELGFTEDEMLEMMGSWE